MANEWQEHCTAELQKCIDLGPRGEALWAVRRWQLHEDAKTDPRASGRIIIADLDASGRSLKRYSFFACYIIRTKFSRADLTGADFKFSIIRDSSFSGSDLTLSTFEEADIEGDNDFSNVTARNEALDFSVIYKHQPVKIDRFLIRAAEAARDIKEADRNEGNVVVRSIRRAVRHGLSPMRMSIGVAIIVTLYAFVWLLSPIKADAKILERFGSSVIVSLRYFLGLTDEFGSTFGWWAIVGLSETAVGLMFLAVLVAAVMRRFTVSS